MDQQVFIKVSSSLLNIMRCSLTFLIVSLLSLIYYAGRNVLKDAGLDDVQETPLEQRQESIKESSLSVADPNLESRS